MLDHLEIDEPKRKQAEEPGEDEADERATSPAVPLHLPGPLVGDRLHFVVAEHPRERQPERCSAPRSGSFSDSLPSAGAGARGAKRAPRSGRWRPRSACALPRARAPLLLRSPESVELEREIDVAQSGDREETGDHDPARERGSVDRVQFLAAAIHPILSATRNLRCANAGWFAARSRPARPVST